MAKVDVTLFDTKALLVHKRYIKRMKKLTDSVMRILCAFCLVLLCVAVRLVAC